MADDGESALERLLFGGTASQQHFKSQASHDKNGDDDDHSTAVADSEYADQDSDDDGSFGDSDETDQQQLQQQQTTSSSSSSSSTSTSSSSAITRKNTKRKPAWQDEEDAQLQIDISGGANRLRKLRRSEEEAQVSGAEFERRLREQFTKLAPPAYWAKSSHHNGNAKKNLNIDFLQDAASIVGGVGQRIGRGILKVRRVKDANFAEPCQAVVQSVQWHPNGNVVMTAAMDKKVRLFQLDGKHNRKIQTFHLPNLPIRNAAITADGTKIVCAGRRKFFYAIDLLAAKVVSVPRLHGCKDKSLETFTLSPDGKLICFLGNDGYLILVNAKTHRFIGSMKMNGTVRAAAFTPDSKEILSVGSDGEVYRWDLRQRRCLQRFQDEGNLGGTSLAISPTGSLFATGSTSGVVNIYDAAKTFGNRNPEDGIRPEKAVMNLTTAIDFIEFNHDASVLCIASRKKKDALRMIHLDSLTAFSNWPTSNTPLHYVNAVAFSPNSGYLGIGNDKGIVLTYRLNQFGKA